MKKIAWTVIGALLLSVLLLVLIFTKPWKTDSTLNTSSSYVAETPGIAQSALEKAGSKTLIYRNSDGEPQWKAVLKGTFLYDGSVAVCTSSTCTITYYDEEWYTASNVTGINGNAAQVDLTTVITILGFDVDQKDCTITLSCDPDGNLS